MIAGPGHRDVDDGVERAPAFGPGQLAHVLDEAVPDPASPVSRVDRDGDLDAVRVVEQRELEQPDAQDRAGALGAGRHHP